MPDVLGGAGGKKRQKKHAEEKKSFRPGDLPPRRGREWNPGAGPRPERDEKKRSGDENDGGGGGGGGGSDARLSNVWYEASETLALPPAVAKRAKEPSQREMDEKERVARGALEERTAAYERLQARGNSADTRWLSAVRASGTAADKIAAATVLAQEDPVANLKSLESLLSLLEKARVKGGKRGAVQAVAALQELFRDALLPPDRKLKYFSEQPLTRAADAPNERKRLMYWHVEDLVKRAYSRFVNALDALSRDPLPVLKEKSVKAAYELLRSRPENEKALLDVIVNKLGDPQRRTASNAAHFLLEIVSKEHPAMKRVVAREVEAFCFRRGVGLKAQYYAAVLLNQFPLNHGEDGKKLASQLVEFYFSLFKVLHARSKEAMENPGGQGDDDGGKGGAKKARWKDGKKSSGGGGGRGGRGGRGGGGRGGRGAAGRGRGGGRGGKKYGDVKLAPAAALGAGVDARVVSALLTGVNRAFPYVDPDAVEPLVEKISPSLFAIAHSPNLGGALQALALLLQLLSARNAVSDRFYRALYATMTHPSASRSSSAAAGQLLSLTFRALKDDPNPSRAAAMIKRLLQVASHAPAPFACGALMLTSEFLKLKPGHWDAVRQPREGADADDVETFVDEDSEDDEDEKTRRDEKKKKKKKKRGGGGEEEDGDEGEDDDSEDTAENENSDEDEDARRGVRAREASANRYDMHKRDPLYARADTSCWWELALLERNVHPSVGAMARSLLYGVNVEYLGDPLADMTLASFLDKWLQKKPKKMKKAGATGGSSAMMKRRDAAELEAAAAVAPGTAEFAALAEERVDPSEVFFHRFYANKAEGKSGKKKAADKKKAGNDDDDDDDDDLGGGGSESESDDDATAERRKKLAARAGIEGFENEDDEADSDADDVDLGDLELPSDDDDDDETADGAASTVVAKGVKGKDLDARKAGFGGDEDDEMDAVLEREEKREERAADADRFNYDALAAAYGAKPGYLMAGYFKKQTEVGSDGDDDDAENAEDASGDDGSEDEDEDGFVKGSDAVKLWPAVEGDGESEDEEEEEEEEEEDDDDSEEEEDPFDAAMNAALEADDDDEPPPNEDVSFEGSMSEDDDDDEEEPPAPAPASAKRELITLTAAAPGKGKKGGGASLIGDATFASYDDYEAMIDEDFSEHPPAGEDDGEDDGDGGDGDDDDEALAAALGLEDEDEDGEDEEEEPPAKKKAPTPPAKRVTRSSAKRPSSAKGSGSASKKKRGT